MRPKHHVAELDFSLASVLKPTCGVCVCVCVCVCVYTAYTLPSHLGLFYLILPADMLFLGLLEVLGGQLVLMCIQGSCTFVQRYVTVEYLGKDWSSYVWVLGSGPVMSFV